MANQLKKLAQKFDNAAELPVLDRIYLYRDLLVEAVRCPLLMMDNVVQDAMVALRDQLVASNDFYHLTRLGNALLDAEISLGDTAGWIYPSGRRTGVHRTIYTDNHNAHAFMRNTVAVARRVQIDYPSAYNRSDILSKLLLNGTHGFSEDTVTEFLDFIETVGYMEVEDVNLPLLLASVVSYIQQVPAKVDLTVRLYQEIQESKGTCVSGHLVRMINALNGYTHQAEEEEEYTVTMPAYEYEKAKAFSTMNRLIDGTNAETIYDQVIHLIESGKVSIPGEFVKEIVREYTK